VKYKFNQLYF